MRRIILAIAAIATLAAAGCSSTRFGGPDYSVASAPPRLPAAPAGSVQTGSLPRVTASGPGNIQPVAAAGPLGGQVDPAAQGPGQAGGQVAGQTQVAAADSGIATATNGQSLDVTENSLIGNWTTSVNGSNCATFFGLTNLGSGLLGGTRGCPGDLSKFRTWRVAGNSATLRDSTGGTVATLRRTGDKTFAGTTTAGESFVLTR